MNTSKTVSQKVNGGKDVSQDQRHLQQKRPDTNAAGDEKLNQQDRSKPQRMNRETAERIPADPDPDDPASP